MYLLRFLLIIACLSFHRLSAQHPCASAAATYSSYELALSAVREANFNYSERLVTDQSSWIRLAEFYCCEAGNGFLVITTDKNEYIHQGVPLNIWEAFKAAPSRGGFYNQAIKGHYQLILAP